MTRQKRNKKAMIEIKRKLSEKASDNPTSIERIMKNEIKFTSNKILIFLFEMAKIKGFIFVIVFCFSFSNTFNSFGYIIIMLNGFFNIFS